MIAFRFTEPVTVGAMTVTGITVVNQMCAGSGLTGLLACVSSVAGIVLFHVDQARGAPMVQLIDHCCARVLPAAVWS